VSPSIHGEQRAAVGSEPSRRGITAPSVNLTSVTNDEATQAPERASLIERRARRIANARSVVLGLSVTFVGLAFVGAIVMRIVDPDNFPSLGLAVWWALQTVTTVGYGDVVPTTGVGQVIGGIEMVLGISFIAFLTAGVTSVVIQRASGAAQVGQHAQAERNAENILGALVEARQAITELDARLDRIESKITA
jgi:voltage-gated potassium channel